MGVAVRGCFILFTAERPPSSMWMPTWLAIVGPPACVGRFARSPQLGGGGLDAAVLALPLRRVIGARHPRVKATAKAVAERLCAGGGFFIDTGATVAPDELGGGPKT